MDNNDFSNLVNQIKSTVDETLRTANSALEDAVKSEKFNRIKNDIYDKTQDTINGVLNNININIDNKARSINNKKSSQKIIPKPPRNLPIPKRPHGSVSSVLLTIFGTLSAGVFGILLVAYSLFNSLFKNFILPSNIAFGVMSTLLGLSLIATFRGMSLRKRILRFKEYAKHLKINGYCSIKELSAHTGNSPKFIIKDFKRMVALRMFPEGHIDDEKTCLMLTNEVYDEYLKTKEALKLREEEELRQKEEEASITDPLTKELRQTIKEGRIYINEIKKANDAIASKDISSKLYKLEDITIRILEYVENHPEKLSEIHKFMNYYLPTTLKLVNTYKELDNLPVQGDNIINSKNEIKNSLDMINKAFENLLNELFKDIAFDVSSDISVLKTMFAQEGLTDSDFKK